MSNAITFSTTEIQISNLCVILFNHLLPTSFLNVAQIVCFSLMLPLQNAISSLETKGMRKKQISKSTLLVLGCIHTKSDTVTKQSKQAVSPITSVCLTYRRTCRHPIYFHIRKRCKSDMTTGVGDMTIMLYSILFYSISQQYLLKYRVDKSGTFFFFIQHLLTIF